MFGESRLVKKQVAEIESLKEKIVKQENEHSELVRKITNDHADEITRILNKHSDEKERITQSQDIAIHREVSKISAENTALKISQETLKNKVEMYEAAFKNLGFDVKDMKEILNKLVDGVVAKGTIQLVK